ncbi:MAG: chemotaxis protein CheW [Chloroflexota bacterium]
MSKQKKDHKNKKTSEPLDELAQNDAAEQPAPQAAGSETSSSGPSLSDLEQQLLQPKSEEPLFDADTLEALSNLAEMEASLLMGSSSEPEEGMDIETAASLEEMIVDAIDQVEADGPETTDDSPSASTLDAEPVTNELVEEASVDEAPINDGADDNERPEWLSDDLELYADDFINDNVEIVSEEELAQLLDEAAEELFDAASGADLGELPSSILDDATDEVFDALFEDEALNSDDAETDMAEPEAAEAIVVEEAAVPVIETAVSSSPEPITTAEENILEADEEISEEPLSIADESISEEDEPAVEGAASTAEELPAPEEDEPVLEETAVSETDDDDILDALSALDALDEAETIEPALDEEVSEEPLPIADESVSEEDEPAVEDAASIAEELPTPEEDESVLEETAVFETDDDDILDALSALDALDEAETIEPALDAAIDQEAAEALATLAAIDEIPDAPAADEAMPDEMAEALEVLAGLNDGEIASETEDEDYLEALIATIDSEVEAVYGSSAIADLTVEQTTEGSYSLQQYVVFALSGSIYAAPAAHVREVSQLASVTRIPNVPNWLLGVTNLRGDVLSLIGLRAFLGLTGNGHQNKFVPNDQQVMVVHSEKHASSITTGLVVDEIQDIRYLDTDKIDELSAPIEDQVAPYLQGVYEEDGRLLILLDLEKLLLAPEMWQFDIA